MAGTIQNLLLECERIFRFAQQLFKQAFTRPFEWRETTRQCYTIGNRSLFLVCFTAFLSGVVFTRQSRPSLSAFGAESWLPSLVSQAVVRSLGPLITGLICAGKLGSNIAAELASMKVTEQIDAMEVSGTGPFAYLVVSRVIATTLMMPILVVFADAVALLGSYLTVHSINNTSPLLYLNEVSAVITYLDIFSSVMLATFFGLAIGFVGSYAGYTATNGTSGVGKAANNAVVVSMLCILLLIYCRFKL